MDIEIWKDIPNYEDYYQVSNLSRVRSLTRYVNAPQNGGTRQLKSQILKQAYNTAGYLMVGLSKKGKNKPHRVHRLLATAFIPNPENKPTINHINGIKDDNRLENIEWHTYSENNIHAIQTGLRDYKKISKPVKISKNGVELYFKSGSDASRYLGCHFTKVQGVANPNEVNKSIYGWKAEYTKEEE
jgi:hypothetical protein